MRLLRRNTTEFEYLPNDGLMTDLNDDGEHTGEFHPQYGTPRTYRGNISSPSGHTVQQFYGEEVRYTHTLVMDKPDTDINEYGVIRWKGELYDITAVRPSLNALSIALRKQTVDYTTPDELPDEEEEPYEPAGESEPDGDGE